MSVLTTFIIPFFIDFLKEETPFKNLATIIGLAIAIIILLFLSFILEELIDRSSGLRKFISPATFIEGYWYDITFNEMKLFYHIVILYIEYDQGKYKISGETFNKTSLVAIFNSLTSVSLSNNDLLFQTEGNYKDKGDYKSLDSFKFNTPSGNSNPSSYKGFYIDYTSVNLKANDISGSKISDDVLKKYNSFRSTPDKLNFVKQLTKDGVI